MEKINAEFKNFTISETITKKKIYIDAYNNLHKFYNLEGPDPPDHWDLETPFKRIKLFVDAAQKSGYSLKLFIKHENVSEEDKDNWMKRRENDVRKCEKYPPPKCGLLLWNFFMKCNVESYFTYDSDYDDSLASHAQHDGASILTRDRDYFRYLERNYEVYEDFHINSNGFIEFKKHNNPTKKFGSKAKNILSPPPKILKKNVTKTIWSGENKNSFFGSPSPLIQIFSNPYLTLRPFRQAAYFKLGIKEKNEYIILWDDEKKIPIWDVTIVQADKKYSELLTDPVKAVDIFFNLSQVEKPLCIKERLWFNHIYCLYSTVFEICSLVVDDSEIKYFEMMEKFSRKPKNYICLNEKNQNIEKSMLPYNTICLECKKYFGMNHGEVFYYKKKGLILPKRCKECRDKKKKKKILMKKIESEEEYNYDYNSDD